MAQLIVRSLDDRVKRELKRRASRNGRSLEGEVREILNRSVERDLPSTDRKKGLGTELAELFAGKVPADFEIPDIRSEPARPAKFKR